MDNFLSSKMSILNGSTSQHTKQQKFAHETEVIQPSKSTDPHYEGALKELLYQSKGMVKKLVGQLNSEGGAKNFQS